MSITIDPAVLGFQYHVNPYTGLVESDYPPASTQTGPLVRFDTPVVRLPYGAQPTTSWGRAPVLTPNIGPPRQELELPKTKRPRRRR